MCNCVSLQIMHIFFVKAEKKFESKVQNILYVEANHCTCLDSEDTRKTKSKKDMSEIIYSKPDALVRKISEASKNSVDSQFLCKKYTPFWRESFFSEKVFIEVLVATK